MQEILVVTNLMQNKSKIRICWWKMRILMDMRKNKLGSCGGQGKFGKKIKDDGFRPHTKIISPPISMNPR